MPASARLSRMPPVRPLLRVVLVSALASMAAACDDEKGLRPPLFRADAAEVPDVGFFRDAEGRDATSPGQDGGAPEAGSGDAEALDSGAVADAAEPSDGDVEVDAASGDAASTADAAAADASIGPLDAASPDAASPDASAPDASAPDTGPRPDGGFLTMVPAQVDVVLGSATTFEVQAAAGLPVDWAVDGAPGGGPLSGTVAPDTDPRFGIYTAPRARPASGGAVVTAEVQGALAVGSVRLLLPPPDAQSIAPDLFEVGAPATLVTILGSGFTPETQITFGGASLPSASVRWDQLTFQVPAGILLLPGVRTVTVSNPSPGGGSDTLQVLVVQRGVELGPGVPPNAPLLFDTATIGLDPSRDPVITYPEDQSRAPRDFPPPAVSWSQAAGSNLCRLSATAPALDLQVFVRTDNLTPFQNPSAIIDRLAWSTMLTVGAGVDVTFEVACGRQIAGPGGAAALAGNTIDVSAPVTYTVTPLAAGGRIVYFSGFIEGLWRIDVGGFGAQGTPFVGPTPAFALQTPQCVGCHSLTPSGSRMAYTSGTSQFGILDVLGATPSPSVPLAAVGQGEWTVIHPSGRYVAAVGLQGQFNLFDGLTGAFVMPIPVGGPGLVVTQPFWSPLGDRLAFAMSPIPGNGIHDIIAGEIWTIDFSAPSGGMPSFGASRRVVQGGAPGSNAYYPAFSPDGQWLIYNRAINGNAFSNPEAEVYLVRADGQVGPVRLGAANRTPGISNSWPRWAPAVQGGKYFAIFSSRRPYPPFNGTGPRQLWVSEIDVNRLPADPSGPAVWLPGQEPFTGNLTAEWSSTP